MSRARSTSLFLVVLVLVPTVLAQQGLRQLNGDFEMAGDDPTDVPFWDLPVTTSFGGRVANLGQQRDAVLALQGGSFARTDDAFPVTTGEQLVFTVDARVVSGRAKVMIEFMNLGGSTVGLRAYDVPSGTDWVRVGAGTNIVVPPSSLMGRVTLESYTTDPTSGVSLPRQSGLALFDNVVVRNP